MSTQLVPSAVPTIRDLLQKNAKALQQALPKQITVERLSRVIIAALNKNPKLQECSQLSLMGAIVQSAFLGLEPNSPLGEAAIVPFGKEAVFMPMYPGLLSLFRRSGMGKIAAAHIIKKNDKFTFQIGAGLPVHTYDFSAERGDTIGAWAYFTLDSGETDFEIMSRSDIEKIRQRSPGKNSPAWVDSYDEMCRKTVLKRLLKRAPKSVELADAIDIDNKVEAGEKMEFVDILEGAGVAIPEEKKTRVTVPPEGQRNDAVSSQQTQEKDGITDGEFREAAREPQDNNNGTPQTQEPSADGLNLLQRYQTVLAQKKSKHGTAAVEAALIRAQLGKLSPSKMTSEQLQAGIDELSLIPD